MQPTEHPAPEQSSALGRFFRGFFSGAANGLLLVGILYGLLFIGSLIPFLPLGGTFAHVGSTIATGIATVLAVSIFSGMKAMMGGEGHGAVAQHDTEMNVPLGITAAGIARTPVIGADTPAPSASTLAASEQDAAPTHPTRWTERPGIADRQQSSIAEIIAAKGDSPQGLAAALLQQQQASAVAAR